VFFLEKLRDERKFTDVDDLRQQITTDVNAAKKICRQFIGGKS
jgi:FAD synthase